MAPIELRLLGRFVVVRDGAEVPVSAFGGRLPRRLVRLLAARRGEHVPKDVLVESLWPRGAPADPQANLEVLVSRARRGLGDPALIVTGPGGYAFTDDESCVVDAEDVLAATDLALQLRREGRTAETLQTLLAAIERWGGDPLPEDLYEDWAAGPRDRLTEAFQTALELGAEAALALGDASTARSLAERAALRQPLRESAALLLVRALAAEGDRGGALEVFDRYRRAAAEDLGLDPSEEAAALQSSILRGGPAAPVVTNSPSVAATARSAPEASSSPLPFEGRERELSTVLEAGERFVLVAGPSGSGKTRFLEELAARCSVPVIRATAFLPEREEPWGLARSVLREAAALDAGAVRGLPDLAAAAIVDVVPELAELRPPPAARADRASRRALAIEAGRLLLERVTRQGVLLAIDDLQWADATSLRLLAAAGRIDLLRLVLAYRTEEMRAADAAHAFLADVRRSTAVRTIELGPLSAEAIAGIAGSDVLADALETGATATPLVIAEAMRLLEERGAMAVDAGGRRRPLRRIGEVEAREIARSAERTATVSRITRLAEREREVLEVLAALGRETSAATVAAALEREPGEVFGSLDLLAAGGLARSGELGWAAAHDSIAEVAAARIEPGRRHRLHERVARVLLEEDAEPSEVATHLAAAGEPRAAAERYTEAAERALARFATDECLRLVDAAAALEPEMAPRVRRLRAEARARSGDLDGAKADLREALAATPAEADRAELLTRLAVLESGSEDYEAAGRLVELALAAAAEDPRLRAEVHAVGSIVDLNLGELERSRARAATALELFEANGDARGAAGILDGRAMATFLEGRIGEAIAAFDRVARLFRDAGELLRVGTPRSTRGHALVFAARPEEGLADIDEALDLSRSLGHVEGESYSLWHRAEALAGLGDGEGAESSARDALAIAERIGHREWTAASLRGVGIALEAGGDIQAAVETHRRGMNAADGMPLFFTWATARLASCLVRAGRLEEAETALVQGRPDRAPLAAYEVRLAEAELRAARGDNGLAGFATAAAELAADGGHEVSAQRLRALAET